MGKAGRKTEITMKMMVMTISLIATPLRVLPPLDMNQIVRIVL